MVDMPHGDLTEEIQCEPKYMDRIIITTFDYKKQNNIL